MVLRKDTKLQDWEKIPVFDIPVYICRTVWRY